MEFTVRFLCRVQFPRRGAQTRKATSKNPLRLTVLTFVDIDSGRDIAATKNFSMRKKKREVGCMERARLRVPYQKRLRMPRVREPGRVRKRKYLRAKHLRDLLPDTVRERSRTKDRKNAGTVVVSCLHNMTCDRSADAFPGCPSASVAGQTHAQEGFSRTFSGKGRCVRTITRHQCRAY